MTTHGRNRESEDVQSELPDVLQFMQLLWAVAHGLEKTSKRMAQDIGVTGPQRLVLRVVGLHPGLSAGDLASILHVHASTLTGVLQRLVTQRLLIRVDDARDRRRAVLRLTRQGARANRMSRGTVESVVTRALADLTDGDRQAARRVLGCVAEHLDRAGNLRLTANESRTHRVSGRRKRGRPHAGPR